METPYIPILPETLLDDSPKSFDVYFKSSEEKMELYCIRGKALNPEVRQKLHAENAIDTLYILTKDKSYYEIYVEDALSTILQKTGLSTAEKTKLAYESIERSAASLFSGPKAKKIQPNGNSSNVTLKWDARLYRNSGR